MELDVWMFQALAPRDVATAIAMVGLFATLVGASVPLFNSWKAVCWKRAELANSYIKEFNSNDEMVFAGRCLDWEGGRLFLPEKLRAYLPDKASFIEHDKRVMAKPSARNSRWKKTTTHVYKSIVRQWTRF